MTAYYNENDKGAAAWLRELIKAGVIPDGEVDERSITEVQPVDLVGFTHVHFFAGIGGWAYALALAGWPDTEPVWTGSCPCQPFSAAGKRAGNADARHLWPVWFDLIRQCRPQHVIGEQVASAIGHGWLDGISTDLEGEGYACGAVVLGAHSVGAPHIRQRLYWVADAGRPSHECGLRPGEAPGAAGAFEGDARERQRSGLDSGGGECDGRMADATNLRCAEHGPEPRGWGGAGPCDSAERGGTGGLADAQDSNRRPQLQESGAGFGRSGFAGDCTVGGMVKSNSPGRQPGQPPTEAARHGSAAESTSSGLEHTTSDGRQQRRPEPGRGSALGGCPWSDYTLTYCLDGKTRRTQPEFLKMAARLPDNLGDLRTESEALTNFPLAVNVPGRVQLLRGYGNAIVPQCAAEFIKAYREAIA